MQLNGFRVTVPEASEEKSDGYVVLRHGQNFRIELHNGHKYENRGVPSDAEVYVQGIYVGTYRVPYGQTVILEHPADDFGKFIAYKNDTQEARIAGIDPDSADNGLIKVVWKPGNYKTKKIRSIPVIVNTWKEYPIATRTYDYNSNHYHDGHQYGTTYGDNSTCRGIYTPCNISCSCRTDNNLVGGGIGLSGNSDQTFTETNSLDYIETTTTIYLRIAFQEYEPRPIKNTVYKVHSTSIPRPLR